MENRKQIHDDLSEQHKRAERFNLPSHQKWVKRQETKAAKEALNAKLKQRADRFKSPPASTAAAPAPAAAAAAPTAPTAAE